MQCPDCKTYNCKCLESREAGFVRFRRYRCLECGNRFKTEERFPILAVPEEKERIISPGIYRHFKGAKYQVDSIAEHTETGTKYVVYHNIDGVSKTWVRPYDMFASEVDHHKYPDVRQRFRFERVSP